MPGKRNLTIIIFLTGILLGVLCCSNRKNCVVSFSIEQGSPSLIINTQGTKYVIGSWNDVNSGNYYFFLPSYVSDTEVYIPFSFSKQLTINDNIYNGKIFRWIPEEIYSFEKEDNVYNIKFMRSANLHTIYLSTSSDSLSLINENKDYEDTGFIKVVNSNGVLEYNGKLDKISARGNSTFAAPKKSYVIALDDVRSICDLEAGKKWNLLAQFDECDKLHTRLAFDMAKYLDMEYTPDSTWVDLYCDGNYMGLYLLTEAVTVGEGRVDIYNLEEANKKYNSTIDLDKIEKIRSKGTVSYYDIKNDADVSGGYLIEKSVANRIDEEEAYFITELYNYCFTIKSPRHASKEQTEYIKGFLEQLEEKIIADDETYWEYIDVDSLAKQYLIDKITLNRDAMWESTFFYKEKGQEKLKVGPLWDYDLSFGAITHDYSLGIDKSIKADSMTEWYNFFCSKQVFTDKMEEYYCELLPYLTETVQYHIDDYANLIEEARKMDAVVNYDNDNRLARYRNYDNHIRYLKYFIASRVKYLNDLWGIEGKDIPFPASTEEYHKVCYWDIEGQLVHQEMIKDGAPIMELPVYDKEFYDGWHMYRHRDAYVCDGMIPIYEDTDFYLIEQ